MANLLNPLPRSEFKINPERTIIIRTLDGKLISLVTKDFESYGNHLPDDIRYFQEYMEIEKVPPMPDANGWWNMKEKKPDIGRACIFYYTEMVPMDNAVIAKYNGNIGISASHWKYDDGPVGAKIK